MSAILVWVPEMLNIVSVGLILSKEKNEANQDLTGIVALNIIILIMALLAIMFVSVNMYHNTYLHLLTKIPLLISCCTNIVAGHHKIIRNSVVATQVVSFIINIVTMLILFVTHLISSSSGRVGPKMPDMRGRDFLKEFSARLEANRIKTKTTAET